MKDLSNAASVQVGGKVLDADSMSLWEIPFAYFICGFVFFLCVGA